MPNNSRKIGYYGETVAAGYLESKGYKMLAKNYKRGKGEIDIIAKDNDYIVFVEVKYRRTMSSGLPREAVTKKKQCSIKDAISYYISENELINADMRIDVVEIYGQEYSSEYYIEHIENAF